MLYGKKGYTEDRKTITQKTLLDKTWIQDSLFDHKCVFTFKKKDGLDMEELILDLIDYDVEDEYEEDDEEGTITIYGNPKSYAAIQKHLEECGFEDVGGDFTYIPNDMKEVTPEQRETLDKMIERLEEFDDVQTVYTNMQPEEGE